VSNAEKDINVHINILLLNIYYYKIPTKCTLTAFMLQYKYNFVLIQVYNWIFAGTRRSGICL